MGKTKVSIKNRQVCKLFFMALEPGPWSKPLQNPLILAQTPFWRAFWTQAALSTRCLVLGLFLLKTLKPLPNLPRPLPGMPRPLAVALRTPDASMLAGDLTNVFVLYEEVADPVATAALLRRARRPQIP